MDNIYATPNSDVSATEGEVNYSGFWIRVLAALLDSIWLLVLTFTLGWMVYGAIYFESTDFSQGYADVFISYVLPFMLTIVFWHFKSATPGKMIPLFLGIFWVGWDQRKQGWHDKIAGTLVIKEN